MSGDFAKLVQVLSKKTESLQKQAAATNAAMLKAAVDLAKLPVPSVLFQGLMGAYMNTIKKSDGLTSARPATLKAIQTAESAPTQASIRAAVAEMKKHIAELEKTKKAEKKFIEFKKNLEDVIKKTEALI